MSGIPVGTMIGRQRVTGWQQETPTPDDEVVYRVEAVDTVTGEPVSNRVRLRADVAFGHEQIAASVLTTWLEEADHLRTTGHTDDNCPGLYGGCTWKPYADPTTARAWCRIG